MIISASRRTDIPKYFSEWLRNRVKEGYIDVRNPICPNRISRYSLSPDIVDGIVFWTKDPAPMLKYLDDFSAFNYYFQFSLTPYGKGVEKNLPNKHELIKTFKDLSSRIGCDKVMWRYDPIFLNKTYDMEYQIRAFKTIACELKGYTNKITISFIDNYFFEGKSIYNLLQTKAVHVEQQNKLAEEFSKIARDNEMQVDTCAETIDFEKYGIEHARCVDGRVFEKLSGHKLSRLKTRYEELLKDPAQRKECRCITSIDIGTQNTCSNGCGYCYATTSYAQLKKNLKSYNPHSSLLCSELDLKRDVVTDHRGTGDLRDRSYKFERTTLFDC